MENEKRRQKLITESWFSFSQYTWPLSRCIQILKTIAVTGDENSVTKRFIGEKEKWTKGMISSSMLILFYTIQQVIPNICTNLQNPRRSSS